MRLHERRLVVRQKVAERAPGSYDGRKHSRATRETMHLRDKWVAEGNKTPLQVMLENMRFYDEFVQHLIAQTGTWMIPPKDDAERRERLKLISKIGQARANAQACAVDAAPYMHQKLNVLDIKGSEGKAIAIILSNGEELL